MTVFVTAPPKLKRHAEMIAYGESLLTVEEIKVVIDPKCPPGKVYITDMAKPFKGPDPRPVKKPSKKKGKK